MPFKMKSIEASEELKNEPKHTPGPWARMWEVDGEDQNNIFVTEPGKTINFAICEVFDIEHGLAEANSALIKAAPDLLAALEDLWTLADNAGAHGPAYDNAKSIIAQAKGRSA